MVGDPFIIKEGSTRPTYVVQLRENIGSQDVENPEKEIDLTGATGVMMSMRISGAEDDAAPKFKKAATFLDRLTGEVEYLWDAGDTDGEGEYETEFEITWAPGETEIVPNDDYFGVTIKANLG